MAFRQQGLSRTLPKNFTFPTTDGEPRTPQRASIHLDVPPAAPRHSTCRPRKSRVRSGTDIFARSDLDPSIFNSTFSDIPLPSIEVPSPCDTEVNELEPRIPIANDRFLAPPRERLNPKTPPAQIRAGPTDANNVDNWSPWDHESLGTSIQRPGSACSNASNSSVSSIETFASRPSIGGSCTSIESDTYDPFVHIELPRKEVLETPSAPRQQRNKPRQLPRRERWTLEMDNHLWNTYQLYLQDPTITPFKMTPGSIPPLGVTHRVAREAKRTWHKRRLRFGRPSVATAGLGTRKIISAESRSGSTTPTAKTDSTKPSWPKSETSTRRRLKLLCKRKFSITPYYQRMMESRSPEPLPDLLSRSSHQSPRVQVSDNSTVAFATRDLGVSLVASSVPGPLTELATEDVTSEWFNNPVQHSSKNLVPGNLTNCSVSLGDSGPVPRLGSPFIYKTWGPDNLRQRTRPRTPMGRRETIHVTDSRLRPFARIPQMGAFPSPASSYSQNPLASEAASNEQDTDDRLEELIRENKLYVDGQRRVRIRNRGATVSGANSRGLNQLFSPPSRWNVSQSDEHTPVEKPVVNPLLNLGGESIKRLGSPFKMDTVKRPEYKAKFVRHAPSLSDPFASNLMSAHARPIGPSQEPPMASTLAYDPIEEGISDAERIRRQILNAPFAHH